MRESRKERAQIHRDKWLQSEASCTTNAKHPETVWFSLNGAADGVGEGAGRSLGKFPMRELRFCFFFLA